MPRNRKRLTSLPGLLHAAGYTDVPDYKLLQQRAVNVGIPGALQINNIWHFGEDDLAVIAEALGLRKRPGPKPADRQQQPTEPRPTWAMRLRHASA